MACVTSDPVGDAPIIAAALRDLGRQAVTGNLLAVVRGTWHLPVAAPLVLTDIWSMIFMSIIYVGE